MIVMPIYEYLPIIGSVLAMLAGMTNFWRDQSKPSCPVIDEENGETTELVREREAAIPLLQREGALVRPSRSYCSFPGGASSISSATRWRVKKCPGWEHT